MGLSERRLIESAKKEHVPAYEAKLRAACGFDVKVEVDWESFGEKKAALEGLQSGLFTGCHALEQVCRDDLGREAVRLAVQVFRLVNVPDRAHVGFEVTNGVVTARLIDGGAASIGYAPDLKRVIEAAI